MRVGWVRLWDLRKVSGEKESNIATVTVGGRGRGWGCWRLMRGGGLLGVEWGRGGGGGREGVG